MRIASHFTKADLSNLERSSGEVDLPFGYQYAGRCPDGKLNSRHLVILGNICPGVGMINPSVNYVVVNVLDGRCISLCHEFLTNKSLEV